MTTGTVVVQRALAHLGAHSPLQPANPESLDVGKDVLNSMLAWWEDEYSIKMGTVPLETVGSELSEPMGARNHLQYCLAVALAPDFPGSQVSASLQKSANTGFQSILRTWGSVTIPKKVVRNTLPKGQGNKNFGRYDSSFFEKGAEIG